MVAIGHSSRSTRNGLRVSACFFRINVLTPADAEDLALTSLFKVARTPVWGGRFEENLGHPFAAWMFRIAHNARSTSYVAAYRKIGLRTLSEMAMTPVLPSRRLFFVRMPSGSGTDREGDGLPPAGGPLAGAA